jgi:hypothetical protein
MARKKSINFPNSEGELSPLLDKLQRSTVNSLLNAGGLVIHGSASKVAKTVNTIYCVVDGVLMSKAAADMPTLVGTVTAAKFNVFVFTTDVSGNLKAYMGTEGAALINVVFPAPLDGEVVIGFVIINPTGTGNFVGGTTAIDDATVVPGALYVDTVGEFFPQFSTL